MLDCKSEYSASADYKSAETREMASLVRLDLQSSCGGIQGFAIVDFKFRKLRSDGKSEKEASKARLAVMQKVIEECESCQQYAKRIAELVQYGFQP